MNRIQRTLRHISPEDEASRGNISVQECASQDNRQKESPSDSNTRSHHQGLEKIKWNGWGYIDTELKLGSNGQISLTGSRYEVSGSTFPKLRPWAEEKLGLDINMTTPITNTEVPNMKPSIKNADFLKSIEGQYLKLSFEDLDRFHHAHGHSTVEVFKMRYGNFERVPDVVIWPGKHEHVEQIVKQATLHNCVIIPFGGGTNVSNALQCSESEARMIISLDMHEMNRIKWIDHQSLLACIECGVIGKDLDEKLAKLGYCLGHEPDSSEFSSLGGWIATRASGMKKNVYGNIEDLLISVKTVTPIGLVERECNVPRISAGPDINQMILGSEGTLGVMTEAVLKIRPLPECRKFGSIVFPDFESGVACFREIARNRCAPASIRLMDNMQFQFGQVLKPGGHSQYEEWIDAAKKWYITQYKGFDVNKMVAATLLFEGNTADVLQNEKKVYAIASRFNGISGGEEAGKRGYFLTYMIAYLRDFAFNYSLMAESFETSVQWANVQLVCDKVKERIRLAVKEHGIKQEPFVTCRVTQAYDAGAAIYFYFAFVFNGLKDPVPVYADIENQARDEIMKLGGSISHHHGVGKLRKQFMPQTYTAPGLGMLRGLKDTVDPKNIFAAGNLV